MSSYIDLKFINDISSRLNQFKKKTDYLFNFRCPHCGDSQKSKTKARAYLYRVKNDMFFKCHNCGQGQNFANFLKFVDPKLYSEYVLERYKGSAPATPTPKFDFQPVKFKDQKIFGLERVNFTQEVKIVEGPIDSLFISNCIAAAGADLLLKNKIPNEKVTYIFDNEPRNKEIVDRMYKVIEKNYNIVIWPDDIQLKDVNDMIINGTSPSEIENIISKNTYNKLSALTKLTHWKKV
jgi:transcription elongation factor Elf1